MGTRKNLLAIGILCALLAGAVAWYLAQNKTDTEIGTEQIDSNQTQDPSIEDSSPTPNGHEPNEHEPSEQDRREEPDEEAHLSWGPTTQQYETAEQAASKMSDSELAGQVIIAHWPGTSASTAVELLSEHKLAGIIFMGGNIETASQIREVAAAVQNEQKELGRTWPAIISVDQEGGRVSRLANVIDPVPSFAQLSQQGAQALDDAYGHMGTQLRDLGFTLDFAPVADVSIGPQDPTIGDRSASTDPVEAAESVQRAVESLTASGVLPAVKHFPGHGSVTIDSHVEVPVQKRGLDELRAIDFVPFREAVAGGAPIVMMGHIALEEIDPNTPATLSPDAYQLLRDELEFEGVVVTDAMNMAAITKNAEAGEETVAALAAGADLVLMPPDTSAAHEAVVTALDSGELQRAKLEESAARVIALQMWQSEL